MANSHSFSLHQVESNYQGFSQLVNLAEDTENLSFNHIVIDMRAASWIDANLCAPFIT